ncbi:MAG: zf-HC2 domain-containing protein [Deltaproteobacteria bacterium]|nr:zf-HC2 domain-containing protein [Deltaproteobacteria bacterium]
MNCKELVYLLGDYLEGTMEEPLRQEFSLHLEMCEPCMNFLRTYDTTRILCRQIRCEEIPEEVRTRLKAFVMEKVREHNRDIEKYVEKAAIERREQVSTLLRAYAANRLSPMMAVLFQTHNDRCETCGAFLRSIDGGKSLVEMPKVPPDIEEHIAEFLEALPPGEAPTLS